MADRKSGVALVVVLVPALVLGIVFAIVLLGGSDEQNMCLPGGQQPGVTIDPDSVPDTPIAGYEHEQLVNAAWIMQAANALGLSARDQTIGVMTAMGESSLRVLDHGDAAGPDSRGLFQQRDNGAWGSYEDRMDPFTSATNFFNAMIANVPDRDTLEPTIVAHRVQRNADPYHYTRYWPAAVQVVEGLSGVVTPGCEPTTPGEVSAEGWAQPAAGPVTSSFGMRRDPVTGSFTRLHAGVDLGGGGDGGPIWAAQDGVVIDVYTDSNGGWTIDVDHGGGLMTRYKHMWASGVLVSAGDRVTAGQQIGRVGSSGWSTGPHLHFEVHVNGSPVDPEQFMSEVGITLG